MTQIALVFDESFLARAKKTISQIRSPGNFPGQILCIIPEDLQSTYVDWFMDDNNLKILSFPRLDRAAELKILKEKPFIMSDGREFNKVFQWHKLYLFHPDILSLNCKIIYIDCGMNIFRDLSPLVSLEPGKFLLAHSDSHPYYQNRLIDQFDGGYYKDLILELNSVYTLDIDYFQSGCLVYNSYKIPDNSFENMLFLSRRYINSRTNEQGIMNLYFNAGLNLWRQLPIMHGDSYIYDFWERGRQPANKYIMLKYPKSTSISRKLITKIKSLFRLA